MKKSSRRLTSSSYAAEIRRDLRRRNGTLLERSALIMRTAFIVGATRDSKALHSRSIVDNRYSFRHDLANEPTFPRRSRRKLATTAESFGSPRVLRRRHDRRRRASRSRRRRDPRCRGLAGRTRFPRRNRRGVPPDVVAYGLH